MNSQPAASAPDPWFEWLTHRRQGGPELNESMRADIVGYRERVLDGARLSPGMTFLDVGTGEGLLAQGAIARVGPSLKVILTDVSTALLRRTEESLTRLGVQGQCTFLENSADDLRDVGSGSVDAAATRSVLVYVADKAAVAREFFRVLKPGGHLSLAEPIYRDEALHLVRMKRELESRPADDETRLLRLIHRWKSAQLPAEPDAIEKSPLTHFTEHDLVTIFETAGFRELHLELHVDVRKLSPEPWDKILDACPRPNTPTLREILDAWFTPDERRFFEEKIRPQAEAGSTYYRTNMAFFTATKPADR